MEKITEQLKQILRMENSPVAVIFTDSPYKEGISSKAFVCRSILRATHNEIINLSRNNTLCEIGNYFLGFSNKLKKEDEKLIKCRIFKSMEHVKKFYEETPKGLIHNSKYVVILPLSKCHDEPDLVLFIINPVRVVKILSLLLYTYSLPSKIYTFGPTCQTAIVNSMVTKKLSISFIDFGARQEAKFNDNDLIVSLPFNDIFILIENSKESIFGKK